jgi:hypothetical protein
MLEQANRSCSPSRLSLRDNLVRAQLCRFQLLDRQLSIIIVEASLLQFAVTYELTPEMHSLRIGAAS